MQVDTCFDRVSSAWALVLLVAVVALGASVYSFVVVVQVHRRRRETDLAKKREVPLVILCVRHCQSTANVDAAVYETTPDHAIPLSDVGIVSTVTLGQRLAEYLARRFNRGTGGAPEDVLKRKKRIRCKMFVSPFRRTRETASLLLRSEMKEWVTDVEESVFLVEQDWGMFEGTGLQKGKLLYPREWEHLQTQKSWRGKFWSRMPNGESAFDVCQRVCQLFGSILKVRAECVEEGAEAQVIIIVSHGITSRAVIMMWGKFSPEWFDSSSNFPNGAVHVLDSEVAGWYGGAVFGGFDHDGLEQPLPPIIPDPVQTHCSELYYKFCTEARYAPAGAAVSSMHRSSKRASLILEETAAMKVKTIFHVGVSEKGEPFGTAEAEEAAAVAVDGGAADASAVAESNRIPFTAADFAAAVEAARIAVGKQ